MDEAEYEDIDFVNKSASAPLPPPLKNAGSLLSKMVVQLSLIRAILLRGGYCDKKEKHCFVYLTTS